MKNVTSERDSQEKKLYEWSKRLKREHPNRILVDKWKPNKRLQTPSIMDKVLELKDQHHLCENREPLNRVPPTLPPHINLRKPDLRKALLDKCNKDSNPIVLKASALETIDSYSPTWVHSYTDGSAFKATINAGYGAVINLPNGDKKEVYNSCGSFCSNYIAEQQAITNAADHINFTLKNNSTKTSHL